MCLPRGLPPPRTNTHTTQFSKSSSELLLNNTRYKHIQTFYEIITRLCIMSHRKIAITTTTATHALFCNTLSLKQLTTTELNYKTLLFRSACCSGWRRLHNTVSTSFKTTFESELPIIKQKRHLLSSNKNEVSRKTSLMNFCSNTAHTPQLQIS